LNLPENSEGPVGFKPTQLQAFRQLKFGSSTVKSLGSVARPALISAIFFGGLASVAASQEQSATAGNPGVVSETFDGGDTSVMLGGQLDIGTEKAPWVYFLSDGALVMENRSEPLSIHYNDIFWAKYPDSDTLESTEGAIISATVEADNEGPGGIGILIGSGEAGAYLAFLVDGQGQYHVFQKEGTVVKKLNSGRSAAIKVEGPNSLTFEVRGENVLFRANSDKVIEVPYSTMPGNGQGGLGLAAYGIGQFRVEDVAISRGN
jgi:hypothetical protein